MSKTNSTKETNATKSDLQLVLEEIFRHWAAHQPKITDGRPLKAFAKSFDIELPTFTRWLNGKHVPQGDLWVGFIEKLRKIEKKNIEKKTDAQSGTSDQKELLFDESWVERAEMARERAAQAERARAYQ